MGRDGLGLILSIEVTESGVILRKCSINTGKKDGSYR